MKTTLMANVLLECFCYCSNALGRSVPLCFTTALLFPNVYFFKNRFDGLEYMAERDEFLPQKSAVKKEPQFTDVSITARVQFKGHAVGMSMKQQSLICITFS